MGYRLEEDKTVTYSPDIIKREKIFLCSTSPFDGCNIETYFLTCPSHSSYDNQSIVGIWPSVVFNVISQYLFQIEISGASERFNTMHRTKTWEEAVHFHGYNHNNLEREFERQLGTEAS